MAWIDKNGVEKKPGDWYVSPDGTQYPPEFPAEEITALSWVADPVPDPPTPAEIAAALAATKTQALRALDLSTDSIYGAVLGNRAEEYSRAAEEAGAYKAAGYTGSVPSSVLSWANAKGWTATQATDDILATAAQWTVAQAAIRSNRLACKEQVRNAADTAGVDAALAAWGGFASYIRSQLGVA